VSIHHRVVGMGQDRSMIDPDALNATWRRLRGHLDMVRSTDGDDLRDAAVGCLHEIYDLWEIWSDAKGLSLRGEDDAVESNADGESAAALVFVRGGRTHGGVEPGELFTFGSGGFGEGPYGGGWAWHNYSDTTNPRYARRNTWYHDHVRGRLIIEPLDAAVRWLELQPELTS
jgi:hypothetical protein